LRLFALLGALLIAGGVYLLIDGGLRLSRALGDDTFSYRVWTAAFWLAAPETSEFELALNAHWLVRIVCGLAGLPLGTKIVRVATR
jgi:hypothetical protein